MSGSMGDGARHRHSNPLRRDGAPAITIDTSAVSPGGTISQSQNPASAPDHQAGTTSQEQSNGASPGGISPTDARSTNSAEWSRESRPISPHNVSSPSVSRAPEAAASNFLSVPGTRSRGSSLESEGSTSSGGETYVQSTSSPTDRVSRETTRAVNPIMNDEEALQPDPGTEKDFQVENNKFAFSPGQLNKLVNPKSLSAFHALGGLAGLEKGLRTDRTSGLSVDETTLDGTVTFEDAVNSAKAAGSDAFPKQPKAVYRSDTQQSSATVRQYSDDAYADRKRVFGANVLPAKKAKSIWELAWIAYNDKVLLLLTAAAAVSLGLGIYQSVEAKPGEPRVQWVEGVAIIVAILIVVIVGAANDYQKELQFIKLNKKKEDRRVKVIRSGKTREISVHDVLVGDVLLLEPGDLVPVDGILIEGHNVKCDESSATGESDVLRKVAADEAYRAILNNENLSKVDPFILSGAKVSEGVGRFLVTSVGVHSVYGKTMMSLQDEGQTTPLQMKLNILAEYIAKLGLASGLLLFVVLFIKFCAQLGQFDTPDEKGQAFLKIFIVAVTIIVVAVPEGLPLAVTLALAFATTRMLRDNNLVRLLRACETMGNATTICSDKTGTLTQNKMSVVAGALGPTFRFSRRDQEASDSQNANSEPAEEMSPQEFVNALSAQTKELLLQSIVVNSTAFEGEEEGKTIFVGSKTETALLTFARDYLGLGNLNEERSNAEVAQMVPFDSSRKCMAVVVKKSPNHYRMLVKGAAEILLSRSTRLVSDPKKELADTPMSGEQRLSLETLVNKYATRSLRAIALVYRDFEQWPPRGAPTQEDDRRQAVFDAVFKDMVFLGIVGIQDPLRPGVTDSVHQCQRAGVFVRMVTGDNINTAKAIAQEAGIFTPGGVAMEGPKFRKLSSKQMNQILPRLQVLARSSPEDKKILVTQLKKLGETVAVTGDGTNDAAALRTADVGFSMGITGTEVAKEASDIILMDDNFTSIVRAIAWGRTVNDAVKKFLQFQITVNITAVILTFVSAVASGDETSVLTAVQLLWVNLIMDTFAALALATDPPSPRVLERRPEPKSAPLITLTMWKMILGQVVYQLVVTFVLNFAGLKIFRYSPPNVERQLRTVVFNTFVWMQIFNQYNCRRLDNNVNIFEGILRNRWFLGIQFIIVGGQILIIFVGGQAFSVTRLNASQWGTSLVLGALSMPVAVIIRLIPDEFIRRLIPNFWRQPPKKQQPQVFVSDETDRQYEWNPALEEIRDQLVFLKTVRGGRLRNLKYKLQHPETLLPRSRSGSRSRDTFSSATTTPAPPTPNGDNSAAPETASSPPPRRASESRSRTRARSRSNSAFGPAAAMAGVVAGSIAGWSPIERNPNNNSRQEEASWNLSSTAPHSGLNQQQGIDIHPDTAADDPIIVVDGYDPATARVPPSQNPDLVPVFEHRPPDDTTSTRTRTPSRGRRGRSSSRRSRSNTNTNASSSGAAVDRV